MILALTLVGVVATLVLSMAIADWIRETDRETLSIDTRASCEDEIEKLCRQLHEVCMAYDEDMQMFNVRIYGHEDKSDENSVKLTFHNEYWDRDRKKPLCRIVFSKGDSYNERGEQK